MAILKIKEMPKGFYGTADPNTAGNIMPTKIGDIYIRTNPIQLFFAFGMSGTQWGTCGTLGA